MFDILEANKDTYGIASYGVSITTMEEVFLQVGAQEDEELETLLAGRNLTIVNGSHEQQPNGLFMAKVDPTISLNNGSIEKTKNAIKNSRQTNTRTKNTESTPLSSVSFLPYLSNFEEARAN